MMRNQSHGYTRRARSILQAPRKFLIRGWYEAASIVLALFLFQGVVHAQEDVAVSIPGRTIRLSKAEWAKVEDPDAFAKNFEERKRSPWRKIGRIVTIYLNRMSDDRRLGIKISDNEYIEFLIVHIGYVTAQTRADKGECWVLCRETFLPKPPLPLEISAYRPFLTSTENRQLWQLYQAEIDETRYMLHMQF